MMDLNVSYFFPKVTQDDFMKAKDKALYQKKGNIPDGMYL